MSYNVEQRTNFPHTKNEPISHEIHTYFLVLFVIIYGPRQFHSYTIAFHHFILTEYPKKKYYNRKTQFNSVLTHLCHSTPTSHFHWLWRSCVFCRWMRHLKIFSIFSSSIYSTKMLAKLYIYITINCTKNTN